MKIHDICLSPADLFHSQYLLKVKVTQSCLTLRNPMNCSLPGSSVHGTFQARLLEWVAYPSSRGSSQHRLEPKSPAWQTGSLPSEPPGKPKNTRVGSLSLLQGNLLNPGIKPGSPALQEDYSPAELLEKPVIFSVLSC